MRINAAILSKLVTCLVLFMAVSLVGCDEHPLADGDGDGDGNADGDGDADGDADPASCDDGLDMEGGHIARDMTTSVGDEAMAELIAGNNAFAAEFYGQLQENTSGNIFYSPLSVSLALAMTYAGARGDTETEMAEVLHFTLPQAELHPAFNELERELESRGDSVPDDEDPFTLTLTNSLWGQVDYPFEDAYLETIAANYGSGVRTVDFINDTEGTREVINEWVSCSTEDRIPELIPDGGLLERNRWVLVNAIYFTAAWSQQFEEARTQDEEFTLLDDSVELVPTMKAFDIYPYTEGAGWRAVELPYVGYSMSMVFILPDDGTFEAFDSAIDTHLPTVLAEIEVSSYHSVDLRVPHFEFATPVIDLEPLFRNLGMEDAFVWEVADFTGISERAFNISRIFHRAFVAVDENGTEAAAATAVVGDGDGDADPDWAVFHLNRPFLFLIRDRVTNTVLFLGRVVSPLD